MCTNILYTNIVFIIHNLANMSNKQRKEKKNDEKKVSNLLAKRKRILFQFC